MRLLTIFSFAGMSMFIACKQDNASTEPTEAEATTEVKQMLSLWQTPRPQILWSTKPSLFPGQTNQQTRLIFEHK